MPSLCRLKNNFQKVENVTLTHMETEHVAKTSLTGQRVNLQDGNAGWTWERPKPVHGDRKTLG